MLAALAGTARAQSPRVAVVVRAGAEPPVSAAATRAALVTAGAWPGEPIAVARQRRAEGAVEVGALEPFARARALVDEGWRAYQQVDPAFAEARLVAARREAEALLPLAGGGELMADISLRLGAVRLQRGRRDAAAADFRFAYALDPDRAVTVAELPPPVVDAYRAATKDLAPAVGLAVTLAPATAAIEVDGHDLGGARSLELAPGYHTLVARAPGYEPLAQIVAVGPEWATLALVLVPDRVAAALAGPFELGIGEAVAGRQAEALLVFAELDALVLAAPVWRRAQPALLAQRCAGVPVRCTRVIERGFADASGVSAAAAAVLGELAQDELVLPPTLTADARLVLGEPPPGHHVAPGPPRPWYASGWLWAGAGGAAIAAAAVVLLTGDAGVDTVLELGGCDWGGC
jgi:hypothetical protein